MIVLSFRITLQEPLLATSLGGDPNSATSYPFIPGSLIRGSLANHYRGGRHQPVDLAFDETARELFFDGTVRFLNAYPVDQQGHRMLPVPRAWIVEKGSEPPTTVYDWSLIGRDDALEQPKTLKAPFCHLEDCMIWIHNPIRRFSVHTQRNRQMGRATRKDGAVFRYEALAAGQVFGGVILLDDVDEKTVADLSSLLTDAPLLLGGSHSAGYGRVSVQVDEQQDDWREVSGVPSSISPGQFFVLTLLSDVLVRDENGQYAPVLAKQISKEHPRMRSSQYTPVLAGQMLAKHLGGGEIEICHTFKQTGIIGGFNRKWGLPLQQTPVIRAGSVFTLKSDKPISVDMITALESRGIGYRRVEGLGRVAINWHGANRMLSLVGGVCLESADSKSDDEHSPTLTGKSLDLARTMTRRLSQRKIESKLTNYVNRLDFRPRGITRSQLSRLRVITRSAQKDRDTKRVLVWLERLKRTAKTQFESARVNKSRLMDWLTVRLEDPSSVWTEINLQPDELPAIGGERVNLDDLACDVTLQLIDVVLARASEEVKGND